MPLLDQLTQVPEGKIGSIWLSHDTTETGRWVEVAWPNWATEAKKGKGVKFGADRTPYISIRGFGAKRTIVLTIASCPRALFIALVAQQAADTWYACTFPHPILGTKTFTAQVISVGASDDTAYDETDDPVENVTVILISRSS